MPFSAFDDETRHLLAQVFDGSMLVVEAANRQALSPDRRDETIALITSQLVAAAAEGNRDFQTLQLRALEGIV